MTQDDNSDGSPNSKRKPSFAVLIGDENLEFEKFKLTDPVVTLEQILDVAKKRPNDEFDVYAFADDGDLVRLSDGDEINLRGGGKERFLVFRTDRAFRLLVDGERYDWGVECISGKAIRTIASIPDDKAIWQELTDAPDKEIAATDIVNLDEAGAERFASRPRAPEKITIYINGRKKHVDPGKLSFDALSELAFPGQETGPYICFSVTYTDGPLPKPEGTLGEDESVKLREGMIFNVTRTDKS